MNRADHSSGPCRSCGRPLTREVYKDEEYFIDADGDLICYEASKVRYIAHEPFADSQLEQAQVVA
jgi:hypothetical protein